MLVFVTANHQKVMLNHEPLGQVFCLKWSSSGTIIDEEIPTQSNNMQQVCICYVLTSQKRDKPFGTLNPNLPMSYGNLSAHWWKCLALSLSLSPCVWLSELVFPSILVEILPDVDLPSAKASLHCHGNFCPAAASPPLHGLHNHVGIPENIWKLPLKPTSDIGQEFLAKLRPFLPVHLFQFVALGVRLSCGSRETNNLGNGFVLSFLAV